MKLHLRTFRWSMLPERLKGMFNLNDPRWGRSDEKPADGEKINPAPSNANSPETPSKSNSDRSPKRGPNQGPPDLDELWRDFNRKLGGLFGNVKNAGRSPSGGDGSGNGSGGGSNSCAHFGHVIVDLSIGPALSLS